MSGIKPYCILHAGRQLVLGLEWRYLPVRGARKIRQRLPDVPHIFRVILTPEAAGDPGCLLGTIELSPDSKGREKSYPLALIVLREMPADSYAVCRLEKGLYWFIAKAGKELSPFSDRLGSLDEIRQHIRQFLLLNRPDIQWHEYRTPGGEGKGDGIAGLCLDDLLPQSSPLPRKFRLKASGHRSRLRVAGGLLVLCALVISGLLWRNNWQQQQRIDAAQRYLLQQKRQQAAGQPTLPWAHQPAFSDALAACQQHLVSLPVMIADWGLSHVSCTAEPARVLARYSMQGTGTIDDFIRGLSADGLSPQAYRFNLPGAGDEAELQLALPAVAVHHTAAATTVSLTALVSLAQRTHSQLQLSERETIAGAAHYSVRTFTLVTGLSPRLLLSSAVMQAQNLSFIRLDISRTEGKLLFTVEGRLYEID